MDPETIQAYDAQATTLAARYDAAEVSAFHRLLLAHLAPGSRVMEVGCGSGRDAAFLAGSGFRVVATDASAAMLEAFRGAAEGRRISVVEFPATGTCYLPCVQIAQVACPLPAEHRLLTERFDAIVAMAMLMHLPDADLFEFAYQLRHLLNPGGTVILSVSEGRTVDPASRDAQGRLFRERPPAELELLFERLGFRLITRDENADALGRETLRWTTLVLRLDTNTGTRPVDQIETIINHDRKDATYKLALLRALCDIAQTAHRHVQWHADGSVSVPLGIVTEKWLYYYWPLIDTGDEPLIPQKRGREIKKPLAFRKDLTALAAHYHGQNGLSRFHGDFQNGRLDPVARTLVDTALNQIANTIVVGPVTFASQGGFRFDKGKRTARNRCHTPQTLYESLGRIHFDAGVWRELCLVGHWIGEAIILRWAELTVEISDRQVPLPRVIEKLLTRPETERDVIAARQIYQGAADLACVWTQIPLSGQRFDVDHAIPFTIWHNNDLWNLLPALATANNQKRDRLVSRTTLHNSRENIIRAWRTTRAVMPDRFDLELNRTLFGRNHAEKQWEAPAFAALVEAIETLAIQRGVERWDPGIETILSARNTPKPKVSAAKEPPASAPIPPPLAPISGDSRFQPSKALTAAPIHFLPLVANLAAGPFFDGFETGNLLDISDCERIPVPAALCKKNRFVVRVAGDSMEPLFHIGDLLIFEYHRTPRQDNQIVIAADFTDGTPTGTYAIKRYQAAPDTWRFLSENPNHPPIQIPRTAMPYPILGTFVGKVEG